MMTKILMATLTCVLLTGCPNKKQVQDSPLENNQSSHIKSQDQDIKSQSVDSRRSLKNSKDEKAKALFTKEQRESIYFAGSLEKEITKILTKNSYSEPLTLLSILSYIVETHSGVKKNAPYGLDCTRFDLQETLKDTVVIYKICLKNPIRIAQVVKKNLLNTLSVQFFIKEWSSVVGMTTSITAADLHCDLITKDKKLSELNCQNWRRSINSSEELRLTEFYYSKKNNNQFKAIGGLFKDLVEYKKISLIIPVSGKIKVYEKELEVRDDFANESSGNPVVNPVINPATEQKVKENEYLKIQKNDKMNSAPNKGDSSHGKEEYQNNPQNQNNWDSHQKENSEENNQKSNQENHQKNFEESNQEGIHGGQQDPQQSQQPRSGGR